MAKSDLWTHDTLQADLVRRRQGRKATMAWAEVNIASKDQGRFDVFEARTHDAKGTTLFVGFEVKASRSDLESDLSTGKWRRYLPSCDELYFAIPKGLCDYDDIPATCGVIYRVGERHAGRWNIGRKPEGGHRTMTDLEIWKRLAKKGYYNNYPSPDIRTRIERMRDYQEMGSLSFLISRRVQAEIRDQQNEVWNERRRITDVDRRVEQLLAIEEKLKAVPDNYQAVERILRATMERQNLFGLPFRTFTLKEAIAHLTEGTDAR